jgi:hypothetical protein
MAGLLDDMGLLGPRSPSGMFEDVIEKLMREGRIPNIDYNSLPMSQNVEDRRGEAPLQETPQLPQLQHNGVGGYLADQARAVNQPVFGGGQPYDSEMNLLMLLDSVRGMRGR